MKTVMLYGHLGESFGRVHRYEISTPIEAIKALGATIKGFKQKLAQGNYKILVGGRRSIDLEQTLHPISENETIRIVPVISGAGDGLGQIIVGAALIAVSIYMPTVGFSLMGQAFSVNAAIGAIGWSLVLGGVSQMLFKPASQGNLTTEKANNMPSYAFNGAVNTTGQGNPIPVCYGKFLVGSQVISAGLTTEQIAV